MIFFGTRTRGKAVRKKGQPLTVGQFAELMGVNKATIKAWHKAGRIVGMFSVNPGRVQGRLLFPEHEVIKFLRNHCQSYLIPEVTGNYADLLYD